VGVKILALVYPPGVRASLLAVLDGVRSLPGERLLELELRPGQWLGAFYRGGPSSRSWRGMRAWFESDLVPTCRLGLSAGPKESTSFFLAFDETTMDRWLWTAGGPGVDGLVACSVARGRGHREEQDSRGKRKPSRANLDVDPPLNDRDEERYFAERAAREAPFCPFVALKAATGLDELAILDGTYRAERDGERLWPSKPSEATELPAEILRDLASRSARTREEALYGLRRCAGSSAALEAVLTALDDRSAGVRRTAALVAPDVSADDALIPVLFDRLDDTDCSVRYQAGDALARLLEDPAPLVSALAARLDESDPEARWAAAYALSSCGPEARPALPRLLELLRSPGEDTDAVRHAAATALAKAGELPPDFAEPLLEVLAYTTDEGAYGSLRDFVGLALGQVRGASTLIASALEEHLERSAPPRNLPALLPAVASPRREELLERLLATPPLACSAAEAAWELQVDAQDVVRGLKPLLTGPAKDRAIAAQALERHADTPPGETALRGLLDDTVAEVRRRAVEAVGFALSSTELTATLTRLRQSDKARAVRQQAEWTLQRLHGAG
jgi:HEAT repeat protein